MRSAATVTRLALLTTWVIAWTGCGAASPPAGTHAEPTLASRTSLPRARPRVGSSSEGGELTTTIGQGEDAARAALFTLLDALVALDVETMRRLIGEAPLTAHSLRNGRNVPDEFVLGRRESFVQRLVASQRLGRLPEGLTLRDVVDPTHVVVMPARARFPDGVPRGLEPSDLLVRFSVDETGHRALSALATEGRGLIVVRIGSAGAQVVGF